jgi:cytochrome c553
LKYVNVVNDGKCNNNYTLILTFNQFEGSVIMLTINMNFVLLLIVTICSCVTVPAVAHSGQAQCDDCTVAQKKNWAAGRVLYREGGGGAVAACADCHGDHAQGDERQAYPSIGGLQTHYAEAQLHAFKDGSRNSPTMVAIAKDMNDDQMHHAALYLHTLSGQRADEQLSVKQAGGDALVKQGRILFQYGKQLSRDRWLPACSLCHGDHAQGAGKYFPPLAGQHASYIEVQLKNWKQGKRTNDPNGLMTSVAAQLSDQDIKAVAAYLSSYANVDQPVWPYEPREAQQ